MALSLLSLRDQLENLLGQAGGAVSKGIQQQFQPQIRGAQFVQQAAQRLTPAPIQEAAKTIMSPIPQARRLGAPNVTLPSLGSVPQNPLSQFAGQMALGNIGPTVSVPKIPLFNMTTPAFRVNPLQVASQVVGFNTPDQQAQKARFDKIQMTPRANLNQDDIAFAQKYSSDNYLSMGLGMAGGMKLKNGVTQKAGQSVQQFLDQAVPAEGLRKFQRGAYSNVKSIDNPLVQGQTYVEGLKSRIKSTINSAINSQDSQRVEQLQDAIDPGFTKVTKKVNLLDYFRTPENVLKKIGLEEQSKTLRQHYENYLTQLPEEVDRIRGWMTLAPGKDSSFRIFNYLDGKIPQTQLAPNEQAIAVEIQNYLEQWATKLNLPKDKRVSNYITHIFEKGAVEAEFNDEIAKLIDQQVAGKVYNPFLQSRKKNDIPYVQDVWRALDAYTKRAVRAYNMDPALAKLKDASNNLELSQVKYVQRLTERVNLRPTEVDTLIDNAIKSSPVGYRFGQRPVAGISKTIRQQVYRGALGLNVSSALRNLSQGANTYAKLGERWTITGYLKLARNWNSGELERVGVLRDSFIEDQTLSVYKKLAGKVDKGLFLLFEQAEKINRGAAYFGAKAKALSTGMSEEDAILFAKDLTRKTQFQFGSIDSAVALQSDLVKTLTQLGSYSVKQVEFLAEMAKNKEYAGLIRYTAATLVLGKVFKDAFGMTLDLLPQFSGSPTVQFTSNIGPAVFGNDYDKARARKNLFKTGTLLIPGSAQFRKTTEGLEAYQKGYSESATGRVQYPVERTQGNLIKGAVFGKSSFPEAQNYFDSEANVLGEMQSEMFKQASDKIALYDQIMNDRKTEAEEDKIKELVRSTGADTPYKDKFFYYEDGEVKTVDRSFKPTVPEMTDSALLDKKLVTRFKADITKKTNDIVTLYEHGEIDEDEAEKQLKELEELSNTFDKPKKPKKLTITLPRETSSPKLGGMSSGTRVSLPRLTRIKPLKSKKTANRRYTIKA